MPTLRPNRSLIMYLCSKISSHRTRAWASGYFSLVRYVNTSAKKTSFFSSRSFSKRRRVFSVGATSPARASTIRWPFSSRSDRSVR